MAQTPNFGFKLYEADEQPNLLDQYNNAVTAIDAAMKQLQDIVEDLTKTSDLTVDGLANLRDQYNSAMDKIDAQFVVIENDHTETGNQISAINTNMTQLGERVTAAEGKVTEVEGQIGQTSTELAAVRQMANTNATAIEGIDTNLAAVQGNVTNLQAATRSQVIYQAQQWDFNAHGLMRLNGASSKWGSNGLTFTLDAAIPSWANWIDVYFTANGSSFYNEGASSASDTTLFVSPLIVQTFPTKIAKKAASSSAIEIQSITDFCVSLPPMMGTNYQGAQTVTFGVIPFRITGTQLTQNMGLASSDGYQQWKNAFSGVGYIYTSDNPTITNTQSSALIYKIVARA